MIVWITLAFAVLVTVITALAGRGVIPNNGLVGIRTPAIMHNDSSWRCGHRAALPVIVVTTVAVAIGAIVVIVVIVVTQDSTMDATNLAGLGLLALETVGIVAAAIRGNRHASRARDSEFQAN